MFACMGVEAWRVEGGVCSDFSQSLQDVPPGGSNWRVHPSGKVAGTR